jgi:hypothetical protein
MKFLQHIAISLLTLTTILTACGQAPNPTPPRVFKTLGNLEVTLDTAGDASAKIINPQTRSSTPLPDNALTFTRKFSSSFDIETSNERYMSATFEVKNNSGKSINNLSLIAYNQPDQSIAGTAVKNLINFGGAAIIDASIAQGIYPVQSLKRVGIETVVDVENADFQGFTSSDAESIATTAKTNQIIRNEDTPLEYGFIARNATKTRTIDDGDTGSVTLTLRFVRPSDPIFTPYKFVMTFVIVEDSVTRVTRGINETTYEAETRALNTGASELMLIGPDSETPTNTSLSTVRLENAKIGLTPTYLVKPALFMKEVQPNTINNNHDNVVTIKGIKFDTSTSFFIQSTKLEVLSQSETEALVTVPKGFIPSKYGIMAANNKNERNTIYPALTIAEGAPARELDVRENYKSFLDGYVFDYENKQPIKGARISIPGLETTSSDTGYFMLRGVPAGRHVVKIEKKGYGYNSNTGQYDNDADTHESLYRIANVPNNSNSTITLKLVMLEPKTNNVTMIGAEGGIHYSTNDHTTGPFIKIPAGALSKPTPIQFTHLRNGTTLPELNDNGNYLAFAHLGPTGLVFKKPATLFLPLQKGIVLTTGEIINILYFDTKTGTWVDDITSGKISKINGQQYLEYEINHFTWIGGNSPVPSVPFSGKTGTGGKGCDQPSIPITNPTLPPPLPPCTESSGEDPDLHCQPMAGVPTNEGISDENGNVKGTTPGSIDPQDIEIKPMGYGDQVVVGRKTIAASDLTPQKVPCAKIPQSDQIYKNPPQATGDKCGDALTPQPKSGNPVQRFTTRALTGNLILTSSSLSGFKTSLGNFSGAKINPSSLTLSIGGKDVTNVTDITVSRGATYGEIYDGFNFDVKLTDPIKAQPNLEIKLSGTTKDGIPFESKIVAGVAAKFAVAPIHVIKIPSYDSVLEDASIKTPVSVFEHGAVNILYQEGDKLQNFIVNVPVFALDEKGMPVSVDVSNLSLSGLSSGVSSGSTTMTAGLAVVPLTITSSNPETLKLEVSTVSVDGSSRSSARVSTRFIPLIIGGVVVLTADAVTALLGTTALASYAISLTPPPVLQGIAQWVSDGWDNLRFGIGNLINPPVIVPGVQCPLRPASFPININVANEVTQAPFRDTKPLTLPDLQKAKLAPCQSNWTPPTDEALSNLMRQILNTRTPTLLDIASQVLLNSLLGSIFKYQDPNQELNKIVGLRNQTELSRSLGERFISTIKDIKLTPEIQAWQQKIDIWKQNGSIPEQKPQYPQNVGATEHAREMRTLLNGIKAKLQDRGVNGPNNIPKECYSNKDMDYLYALYKLINEALENFDKWGGF